VNKMDNQDRQLQEELTRLKAEYQRLRDEKLRTERDVDHLTGQLRELQDHARQEYGTSDPAALETLLKEKRSENAAMVAEYRTHLETIHRGLAEVEQRVDAAERGNGQGEG